MLWIFSSILGHWKKLHSKVSQGGARGARMNIFQLGGHKLDINSFNNYLK